MGILGLGKVSGDVLERVLGFLPLGEVGLDANPLPPLRSGVVSVNPAIGVPVDCLGFFGFHYAASNVAVSMAVPRYATLTVLLPLGSTEDTLEIIVKGFGREAERYRVRVVAGHTGTYKGVSSPLVVATVLGERVREPVAPSPGDYVVIVGSIGLETLWLLEVAERGEYGVDWRSLTPLPAALKLVRVEGVKLMHDVSEGGLLGALHEISREYDVKISLNSSSVPLAEGVRGVGVDPLLAPSYGSLIAIVEEEVEEVGRVCEELGVRYGVVGRVEEGAGVYVDGVARKAGTRTWIDELYGEFEQKSEKCEVA